MTANNKKIGFLGAGQMAQALAKGLVAKGFAEAGDVYLTDVVEAPLQHMAGLGFQTRQSNAAVVKEVDVAVIAVKPEIVCAVLGEIQSVWTEEKLLLSIATGKTIQFLENGFPSKKAKIVRVMPNTPCLVGESLSAYSPNCHCGPNDVELAHAMLSSVGSACRVEEKLLNAVIGVAGSGVAYFYVMIDALADAGVYSGLTRKDAIAMAAQAAVGAGKMALTGTHPAVLRDQVCSPGGATIRAVAALEEAGFRNAVIKASNAAVESAESVEAGKR